MITKLFIITICLFINAQVFSYSAEVLKDNVELEINGKKIVYERGASFDMLGGDEVCFIKGNGRLLIQTDKYRKQLTKRSNFCRKLPHLNKTLKKSVQSNSRISSLFSKTREKEVPGITTRGISFNRKEIESNHGEAAFRIKNSQEILLSIEIESTNVAVNEELRLGVETNIDCELQVIYFDSGKKVQAFPQVIIGDRYLKANSFRVIPDKGSGINIKFTEADAEESIILTCREGGLRELKMSDKEILEYNNLKVAMNAEDFFSQRIKLFKEINSHSELNMSLISKMITFSIRDDY